MKQNIQVITQALSYLKGNTDHVTPLADRQ